jgi:type VI protein secretion system component Hcp
MMAGRATRLMSGIVTVAGTALLPGPAQAYIGPSFLEVPSVESDWRGEDYAGWIRLEAHYWNEKPPRSPPLYQGQSRNVFSGPAAPRRGPGQLAVALDKRSPVHAAMMDLCRRGSVLPELAYAESSERARPPAEVGPRPASIPEYFEYTLKNVRLSCPVVAEAPEQTFVLRFEDIAWRNFKGGKTELQAAPVPLAPAQRSGKSRAFIVHNLISANTVAPDQCPMMSKAPSEADYFALMTPEQVAAKRAEYAPRGGVAATFIRGTLAERGPDGLNVSLLPGIVRDPGHPGPQVTVARGFNLDGQRGNGTGAQYRDYSSAEGQPGIDNQLFTVDGCIQGFGPIGILTVTTRESRRNGEISMMVLISGIDDDRNDDRVDVTLFFSRDPMVKSADGKDILPGYTFRVTDDPERTSYFQRLRGRIVDGVVLTDPVDEIRIDRGRDSTRLMQGRVRLEFNDDRTMQGLIGGYMDWRYMANYWGALTVFEAGMGYSTPGVYNALKRAADGLPDPVTGELTGLSAAYDIEGVEAYLPPEEERKLLSPGLAYLE